MMNHVHFVLASLLIWTTVLSDAFFLSTSDADYESLIQRHLQENYNFADDNSNTEYFEYDLNDFSLRFDRCQYVKLYDDEMAGDEDSQTPLAVRHFALFRLCPSDECSTCNSVYGRYVMEVDEYLQATVQEQANQLDYMCKNCAEQCNDDGTGCSGCGMHCYMRDNPEAYGYVDAANYIDCQQIQMNNNNNNGDDAAAAENDEGEQENIDDGNQFQLYIGPRCSSNGDQITLGLFSDEYCLEPYTELSPEDLLGYNISYQLLSHTYDTKGNNCLSCKEYNDNVNDDDVNYGDQDNGNNWNDQQDADDVNEMCERVYESAAKCESIYGIYGFIQVNREDRDYENQVENEFMVCEYINSLLTDSYTETGDINLVGESVTMFQDVTPLQKTIFYLLSFSIVVLLVIAFFIQRQIDRSYPQIDLACRSEAQLI